MMNSTLHSVEGLSGERHSGKGGVVDAVMSHESSVWFDSACSAGVRYRIVRVSVGRRIALGRKIREIGRKLEFLHAGDDAREKLEAMVLAGEIDRAYLEWGLEAVEGLTIDGEAATPEMLIDRGPMGLATEILGRIKSECGLSEAEVKN